VSDHRIHPLAILDADECRALDAFGAAHRGPEALPALAVFLRERFGCELNLDRDIVSGFAKDSSNLPGLAEALARPRDERQVAVFLRACRAAGIRVTLSGGRSNLTGSATPEGGVVLSTVSLAGPAVQVSEADRTVVAPASMILEDVRNSVVAMTGGRLFFRVDPTSRTDASVGGCLACNASGFTPGETGAMRHWVKALRLCLPDGRIVAAARGQYVSQAGRFLLHGDDGDLVWPVPTYKRPAIKNAGGPFSAPDGAMDLVDLIVGSEGLFGLVTACTLGLTPRPRAYLDLFFSLPGEDEALRFFEAARSHFHGDLGGLTAFEYFGVNARRYMKHEDRFFRGADPVGIYIQEPLFDREMDEAAEDWLGILAEANVTLRDDQILSLDTDALRALFTEARHSTAANFVEAVQQRGTFTVLTDCVVPPDRFPVFLRFAHERISRDGIEYLAFGHLGDCHLHFAMLPERGQTEAAVAAYDDIVACSADLGGVYSGEHGTGKRKRKDFLRCHGTEAAEQVRRCKTAVDADWLLNVGAVCSPRENVG
jgi:D-lactate dehydrogenase (cytochrome)